MFLKYSLIRVNLHDVASIVQRYQPTKTVGENIALLTLLFRAGFTANGFSPAWQGQNGGGREGEGWGEKPEREIPCPPLPYSFDAYHVC